MAKVYEILLDVKHDQKQWVYVCVVALDHKLKRRRRDRENNVPIVNPHAVEKVHLRA